MALAQKDVPIVLSEDAARGGVTGHNVRYVLAFSLAGVITAFAGISIYFGYDQLADTFSKILALDLAKATQQAAPYLLTIIVGVILAVLLLNLWNRLAGKDEDDTQIVMRIRVVVQFAAICVIMMMYYIWVVS